MSKEKRIGVIIVSTFILFITICASLPVSFDAGGCSGGYSNYVTNENINTFNDLIKDKYNNAQIVSNTNEIADTIYWNRTTMFLNIRIKVNSEEKIVKISGRRYWFEKYFWKVTE